LKFKGLKKNMNYQVRIEPDGSEFISDSHALTKEGLDLQLDSALTSQMIMLTEYITEQQ